MTSFGLFVIFILCIVGSHCQDHCEKLPPSENYTGCCKINLTDHQIDCMLTVVRQQELFLQSENKDSFSKTTELCGSNCFFNSNILTFDNKINYDKVEKMMEPIVGPKWPVSISKICREWIENIESHASGIESNFPYGKCNMQAEKLSFCIGEKLLTTCPDSMWINTSDCNDMRTYLEKCPCEKRGGHQ